MTSRLEDFKTKGKGKKYRNESSSSGFCATKFVVRPPVRRDDIIPYHPFGNNAYERIPVEVQILTLSDHKARIENSDATHEEYKARQFRAVFPAWFPRKIYEPFLREYESIP